MTDDTQASQPKAVTVTVVSVADGKTIHTFKIDPTKKTIVRPEHSLFGYVFEPEVVEYGRIHTDGSRSGGQPVTKDPAAEWQAGYEVGVEAAAKALEADARICDCAALEDRDCACGAWWEFKSISSERAVEIVRALQEQSK